MPEDEEPGLEGKDFYSPERATFASGMHAVIVETDPLTAEIKILKYAVVHDCGHLINPMIVEGQIHGGVAQGVGGALYERMAYDESGQLLNASFMDFLMPYVTEVPDGIDDRPPRDAVAAQPARHQGRGRGRRDPVGRRLRRRDRGRRGHSRSPRCRSRRPSCSRCASSTPEGDPMKITGDATLHAPGRPRSGTRCSTRASWSRTIPGCERLEATGENAYAMTVTAGVAAIKGTYAGSCALSDLDAAPVAGDEAAGRRRARHHRRDRERRASPTAATAPRVAYDADAVVGGMVGGVGQRMLTSVSRRMAGEFFGNVDARRSPARRAVAAARRRRGGRRRRGAAGARPGPGVFVGPAEGRAACASQDDFLKGIVVGAGLVLAGVVVGGLFGRRGDS